MSKTRAVVPYKGNAVNSAVGSGKSRGNPVGNLFIIILFAVPGLIMFTPTTLIVLFGMVPTFVALVADRDPQKYSALTVGPLNFCGVLPAVMELWAGGHTLDMALRMLGNPTNWLIMFGSASLGWLLLFIVPPIVTSMIVFRHENDITRMRARQRKLIEEWGDDVTGGAPPPPPEPIKTTVGRPRPSE